MVARSLSSMEYSTRHSQERVQTLTALSPAAKLRKGAKTGAQNWGITHLVSLVAVMIGKVTGCDQTYKTSSVFDKARSQRLTEPGVEENHEETESEVRDGGGLAPGICDFRTEQLERAIEEATRKCSKLQSKIDATNAENRELRSFLRATGQL